MKTIKVCVVVASIGYFIALQNSCSDVVPIKYLEISTSMCLKNFNTTVCPDSNLYHVLIKGSIRGEAGDILIIGASFADSVVMECGDWTPYSINNAGWTVFERKAGQNEKVDFEYRGYKTSQCLDKNSYFTDAFEYSIYKSTFNEYGNPILILWDPNMENEHFVNCR